MDPLGGEGRSGAVGQQGADSPSAVDDDVAFAQDFGERIHLPGNDSASELENLGAQVGHELAGLEQDGLLDDVGVREVVLPIFSVSAMSEGRDFVCVPRLPNLWSEVEHRFDVHADAVLPGEFAQGGIAVEQQRLQPQRTLLGGPKAVALIGRGAIATEILFQHVHAVVVPASAAQESTGGHETRGTLADDADSGRLADHGRCLSFVLVTEALLALCQGRKTCTQNTRFCRETSSAPSFLYSRVHPRAACGASRAVCSGDSAEETRSKASPIQVALWDRF